MKATSLVLEKVAVTAPAPVDGGEIWGGPDTNAWDRIRQQLRDGVSSVETPFTLTTAAGAQSFRHPLKLISIKPHGGGYHFNAMLGGLIVSGMYDPKVRSGSFGRSGYGAAADEVCVTQVPQTSVPTVIIPVDEFIIVNGQFPTVERVLEERYFDGIDVLVRTGASQKPFWTRLEVVHFKDIDGDKLEFTANFTDDQVNVSGHFDLQSRTGSFSRE